MNDFPAYRAYGVPVPAGAVARIVEGPLDPELVERFDELVTLAFKLGPDGPGADGVQAAVTELGVRLLGDRDLVSDVCCVLGDGVEAVGDVLGALAQLHEYDDLELGPAMAAQIRRSGIRVSGEFE